VQVREASCNCSFREFSTSEAVTSGENLETKRDFLRTLFCTTEREEELLTPIIGTLGVFVVLAITAVFPEDGLILFFLTIIIIIIITILIRSISLLPFVLHLINLYVTYLVHSL
jgi:hypothetical protein